MQFQGHIGIQMAFQALASSITSQEDQRTEQQNPGENGENTKDTYRRKESHKANQEQISR